MATDLTGLQARVSLGVTATPKKEIDLSTPKAPLNLSDVIQFAFGSDADQADQIWWGRRTIGPGATDTLDLAGSLTNAFGGSVTFDNIKAILIFNRSDTAIGAHTATDAAIQIGGAANEFTGPLSAAGTFDVPAGGFAGFATPEADGWAVTPDTADELDVTNLDGVEEALYDIVIIGESA